MSVRNGGGVAVARRPPQAALSILRFSLCCLDRLIAADRLATVDIRMCRASAGSFDGIVPTVGPHEVGQSAPIAVGRVLRRVGHQGNALTDRDRLRQEHLERLGWRFHRIWSQDWFTDKQSEITKAASAYHTAVQPAEIAQSEIGPPSVARSRKLGDGNRQSQSANGLSDNRSGGRHSRGPRPISVDRLSIDEYSHAELAGLIKWIESDTLLRPKEQLVDEAMRELGFRRRGRKIVAAIEQAIETTRHRGFEPGD